MSMRAMLANRESAVKIKTCAKQCFVRAWPLKFLVRFTAVIGLAAEKGADGAKHLART